MIARWLICVALFASPAVYGADNGGSCAAPAAAAAADTKTTVVDVPDYRQNENDDPRATAFDQDSQAYQKQLIETLETSADPRDWALAADAFHIGTGDETGKRDALLKRALAAAPDDVLVSWMVVDGSRGQSNDLALSALETLKTTDSDNAAVWLDVLSVAAKHHDHDGVSAALKRMSATSQFNSHFAEMSEAVVAAYRRFPMPDALYDEMPDEAKLTPKEAMPLIYATSVTSAFALPAFQSLTNACRTDASGRNADRAADCQTIGRMMVANSDTLIGTAIGSAVLRLSRTFDDNDVAAARDVSWIRHQLTKLATESPAAVTAFLPNQVEYHQDWLTSNSENYAMRKLVERAGISGYPPDDWVDPDSRFTATIMASDENYFADHNVDY